jgi:hypothetical protein
MGTLGFFTSFPCITSFPSRGTAVFLRALGRSTASMLQVHDLLQRQPIVSIVPASGELKVNVAARSQQLTASNHA